ncbi:hypothetical protein XHV734_1689 [Xanthomonas hortorum pv. vitians]|nr:hypothetical protein XHV734_1689 [Xanthomonas hortorum pv. vitians]
MLCRIPNPQSPIPAPPVLRRHLRPDPPGPSGHRLRRARRTGRACASGASRRPAASPRTRRHRRAARTHAGTGARRHARAGAGHPRAKPRQPGRCTVLYRRYLARTACRTRPCDTDRLVAGRRCLCWPEQLASVGGAVRVGAFRRRRASRRPAGSGRGAAACPGSAGQMGYQRRRAGHHPGRPPVAVASTFARRIGQRGAFAHRHRRRLAGAGAAVGGSVYRARKPLRQRAAVQLNTHPAGPAYNSH